METNPEEKGDSQLSNLLEKSKISASSETEQKLNKDENQIENPCTTKHDDLSDEGVTVKESKGLESIVMLKNSEDDLGIKVCQKEETLLEENKNANVANDMHNLDTKNQDNEISQEYQGLYGHKFDEEFVLRDEKGYRFNFNHHKEHIRNQERYERVGEAIDNYVFELLMDRCNMLQHFIPFDAENEPRGFFFASANALETEDKLLLLIHGSGVVRAGQWARRIIINENLMDGSQIPYIERAYEEGYEVVVLNTNQNRINRRPIRGSNTSETHAQYVVDHFLSKARAKHIAIMAHSYGGCVTLNLALERSDFFFEKVFAIAFSDSVHNFSSVKKYENIRQFFVKHARNWVASDKKLDEEVFNEYFYSFSQIDIAKVSAGHTKHEWTSTSCMESVFKFFNEQLKRQMILDETLEGSNVDRDEIVDSGFSQLELPTKSGACDEPNFDVKDESSRSNDDTTKVNIDPDILQSEKESALVEQTSKFKESESIFSDCSCSNTKVEAVEHPVNNDHQCSRNGDETNGKKSKVTADKCQKEEICENLVDDVSAPQAEPI